MSGVTPETTRNDARALVLSGFIALMDEITPDELQRIGDVVNEVAKGRIENMKPMKDPHPECDCSNCKARGVII